MLSRTLRRAALDTRWALPPTFLCPWTASLTTEALSGSIPQPPPSSPSFSTAATHSISESRSIVSKRLPPQPRLPSKSNLSKTPLQLSDSVTALLPTLQAQSQIYITAHIHAHGFLVTQGDTIRLPFLLRGVEPGDVLRLNRAVNIGSRDLTLQAPSRTSRGKSPTATTEVLTEPIPAVVGGAVDAPEHFVPHLARGRVPYLDERLFVCRAVVMGVESEPMRVMEKTKRRQRHVKHVKSKHKYTVLRIKELRVRGLEEIQSGELD